MVTEKAVKRSCNSSCVITSVGPSLIAGLDCGLDCWTGLLDWITGSNQTTSKNNDASVALRTNSRSKLTLAYESARISLSLNLLKQSYRAIGQKVGII